MMNSFGEAQVNSYVNIYQVKNTLSIEVEQVKVPAYITYKTTNMIEIKKIETEMLYLALKHASSTSYHVEVDGPQS